MSVNHEKERYLIIFNFGSFIYMFFMIGFSAGILLAFVEGIANIYREPTLSGLGWALVGFITTPFSLGMGAAILGVVGFFPYRWLCKRGWGWPVKGIFIKVQEHEL